MPSSNKNSNVEDYYGYWQLYPNNTRVRRWFLQFEALKNSGPFCMRAIAAFTVAYHVAYYSYQFTAVSAEDRHDLRHVMWLKQKLPFFTSVGIHCKDEMKTEWFLRKYPDQYRAENVRTPILSFCCGVGILSIVLVIYNRYCLDARKLADGEAVDWRLMYYLKKYIPAFRNFGIPYREYKPDDF